MNKSKIKALVTGSAGFIGSHTVDALERLGYDVYGVDDLSGGFTRNVLNKKKFTKLDLRDRKKMASYIATLKPDIIFHLAADATEGRSQFTPLSAVDRNLLSYMNVLVPAIKNGLQKMVLVSSMSVYGKQQTPFSEDMFPQPEDVYGVSKAAMEKITEVLASVHGFKYIIIRPHNVYGPRQNLSDPYRNVIGIFINRAMQGKGPYIYGDGEQKRAFSYIDDVVQPMVKAAFKKDCENKIFNLGSNTPSTINQMAELVTKEIAAGDDKLLKKLVPEHVPDRPREVKYAFCSHRNAERLLDYSPKTSLSEGIKIMVSWAAGMGPQKFVYLDQLELANNKTPKTWKSKKI